MKSTLAIRHPESATEDSGQTIAQVRQINHPPLQFWHIWNMCFGFIGIQFGFALQNANVSRIFQTLGASVDDIPIPWVAAPITGLVIQPIIGYMSDRTWCRLGRRRPYLLCGALSASLALFVMPNSSTLWVAAGMLWILDASLNISLGPAVALVGDTLPRKQRALGFSVQSFFIGISAVTASALPWLLTNFMDIDNTAEAGMVPASVTYAFYIGGTLLLASIVWTVVTTREYTPAELDSFKFPQGATEDTKSVCGSEELRRAGMFFFSIGLTGTFCIALSGFDAKLYVLTAGILCFGALQLIAAKMQVRGYTDNALFHISRDLLCMPRTMKQLAVVQFLTWFALFTLWIYGTPAVTSHHYHTLDSSSLAYSNGADWVGALFAAYNGFAALAAIAIPFMVKSTNRKTTQMINLSLGGLGLVSFIFIPDPVWLLVPMLAMGFAWASILSMPYAILSCSLPRHKMGVYAGIFNLFIVIPQILASSVLALAVHHFFAGKTIYAIALAGGFLLFAAVAMGFVIDESDQ
jgi:maltose/moltooligosaccharide transporter